MNATCYIGRVLMVMVTLCLLSGGCAPLPQPAQTVSIAPDLELGLTLPGDRWVVAESAPDFLVADRAEHLEHDLVKQGKSATSEQIAEMASKRLAGSEVFIFNPSTQARLEIDFSALGPGEAFPSAGAVSRSARFAAESLEGEEGIEEVDVRTGRTKVYGSEVAYRLDAGYRAHGEDTRFVGVIGFAAPYWFYFYYTDSLRDPLDREEMEGILRSLTVTVRDGSK
ncbi:hypothetical protein [Desulfuromonas sp.]|nr:hypothetical protein [Desulfuromonas sp.]